MNDSETRNLSDNSFDEGIYQDKMKQQLVSASQMWGFAAFLLFYMTVNWVSLGLGLMLGENIQFKDVTLDSGKL